MNPLLSLSTFARDSFENLLLFFLLFKMIVQIHVENRSIFFEISEREGIVSSNCLTDLPKIVAACQ